jgi:uncharacterized surface protein with fasciclin (FAS1) repeats
MTTEYIKEIAMNTRMIASSVVILAFGITNAVAGSGYGCEAKPASSCPATQQPPLTDIVSTAQQAGEFTTLLAALEAAGLTEALQGAGPFTVFAPTDKAFAALPKGTLQTLLEAENREKLQSILKYHVVSGTVMSTDLLKSPEAATLHGDTVELTLRINDARVVTADIKATNGVIHVIDRVILPGTAKPIAGHANVQTCETSDKTIVQTAMAAGQFKTLVAALQAADLAGALAGEGPFTVFAPTDEAFARLPEGTVESLVQPQNRSKLQAILKYHVIPGQLGSNDIVAVHTVKTLNGQPIYPSLLVDDAALQVKNIYCRNGVIHVIDRVILPTETG